MDAPANLTADCEPLPRFAGKTCDDLTGYTLNLAGLYNSCYDRHAALAEATMVKP
jgi:hypothetical protein